MASMSDNKQELTSPLKPTIYDQRNPGNYIPNAPELPEIEFPHHDPEEIRRRTILGARVGAAVAALTLIFSAPHILGKGQDMFGPIGGGHSEPEDTTPTVRVENAGGVQGGVYHQKATPLQESALNEQENPLP